MDGVWVVFFKYKNRNGWEGLNTIFSICVLPAVSQLNLLGGNMFKLATFYIFIFLSYLLFFCRYNECLMMNKER